MPGLISSRFVRVIGGASVIALSALPALVTPALAARANQTTLQLHIDDCVIRGSDGPNNGKVTIERWSADGTLRLRETVHSTFGWFGSDELGDCFEYGGGVQPGDVIKTTVKGDTRTFVVPALTVRVDRDSDTAWGATSADAKIRLMLRTTGPDGNNYQRTAHARSDGSYSVDLRKSFGVNVRGWDEVDVSWVDGRGDWVTNTNYAPGVEVYIDHPTIWTADQAGRNASLKLLNAPGGSVVARTGGVVYTGRNVFLWLDAAGEPVVQHEGNRVLTDVAHDASFTIPTLATSIDKRDDVVTLSTGLGAGLAVSFSIDDQHYGNSSFANRLTDADGRVTVDFTGDDDVQTYDVRAGDRLYVTVRMATGDIVDKTVIVN